MPLILGMVLFCAGGSLLWFANAMRFEEGFEFGHKLNVQKLYGSMYSTRFDYPFANEPVSSAAQELFGVIFFADRINGTDWYREDLFPGQSTTVRWREIYFSTFDWTYLPFILCGFSRKVYV